MSEIDNLGEGTVVYNITIEHYITKAWAKRAEARDITWVTPTAHPRKDVRRFVQRCLNFGRLYLRRSIAVTSLSHHAEEKDGYNEVSLQHTPPYFPQHAASTLRLPTPGFFEPLCQ